MARWQPDSSGRLAQAAMALYSERGYEATTVAEIAGRAGVTERTFFRHFADKREVLFAGSADLQELIVGAVAAAPASVAPLDALARGLEAAGGFFNAERRDYARQRQAVIAANAELRERELHKFASLSGALAETLRRRGLPGPAATCAGDVAMVMFRTAFERWIDDATNREFADLVHESLDQLRTLTAAG
jgi:AcrR family transcriptional regulator